MADTIVTIQDYPVVITVSEIGIRGPSGASGGGGGGSISGFAGVTYLNNLSGTLFLTGLGGITVSNIGSDTIQISGNNAAVINLSGINNIGISQSGQVYFVSGINLITTNQTGQFYPTSNPQFYIKSGDVVTISGVLQTNINTNTSNLTQSGVIIESQINSLSGYSNSTFSTTINVQNSGQTLYNLIIGQSGQATIDFATKTNLALTGHNNYIDLTNNAINLSGNLQSTGSFLFGLINASSAGVSSLNSQSGAISLTGAGDVSVIVNGQNFIISGNTGNLIGYATISNLQNTGQSLYNLITGLSGKLDNSGTLLQNQINNISGGSSSVAGVTGISLIGDNSLTGLVNITGVNGIDITRNGNTIKFDITGSSTGISIVYKKINITSGSNFNFILFPQSFLSPPNVLGLLGNDSGNAIMGYQLSGISTSGFYINFSDIIQNNNYYFNYNATTADGFFNIYTNTINVISNANNYIGSGSPEGILSATSGSIYFDWFNRVQYNKISGLSAIGWI